MKNEKDFNKLFNKIKRFLLIAIISSTIILCLLYKFC